MTQETWVSQTKLELLHERARLIKAMRKIKTLKRWYLSLDAVVTLYVFNERLLCVRDRLNTLRILEENPHGYD